MTEETQGTEAGQALDSNPQPAQPVSPSTEAAQVAAGGEATQQPGQTEGQAQPTVNWQERLSRQQSVYAKQLNEVERLAQAERERSKVLEAEANALRMQSMTVEQRGVFQAELAQKELEEQRQQLQQERVAVEGQKNYQDWYWHYVSKGVPEDRLRHCQDFGQMHEAAFSYLSEKAAQAGSAPAQPGAPQPPPVGPGDRVQTGGTGAPPSREFDRLRAEGHRPGSKEFRDYVKKMRRSGSKKLL